MTTPELVRTSLNLPPDSLPGAALVEVSFTDERIKAFHKKCGATVVVALDGTSQDMNDYQHVVTLDSSSAYLAAMLAIDHAEKSGKIPNGSTPKAFAAIHTATFDDSEWATYLPSPPNL